MSAHADDNADKKTLGPNWPWWEPYVFTAFVLAAFVVLLMVFGFIARIPFAEHILFALMTIAAVIEAFRRSTRVPSLGGQVFLVVFFGLASFAYFSKNQFWFGIGYAVLATVWVCLSINAGIARHKLRKAASAKLERAVETLRRAINSDK